EREPRPARDLRDPRDEHAARPDHDPRGPVDADVVPTLVEGARDQQLPGPADPAVDEGALLAEHELAADAERDRAVLEQAVDLDARSLEKFEHRAAERVASAEVAAGRRPIGDASEQLVDHAGG